MAEYQDVYDGTGKKTGRKIQRGEELREGEYFYAVHVYIRNSDGTWLIQQRAFTLCTDPGQWEFTSGGLLSGEDSITGAKREVREEVGIMLEDRELERIGTFRRKKNFVDIWFAETDTGMEGLVLDPTEVADARYVSREELIGLIQGLPYREKEYKEMVIAALTKWQGLGAR